MTVDCTVVAVNNYELFFLVCVCTCACRLFPKVRISCDIRYRFNIRFIRTTPFEDLCMQRLRHMVMCRD